MKAVLHLILIPLLLTDAFAQDQQLSFAAALEQILGRDTSLRAQKARVEAAEANLLSVSWHLLPDLQATGSLDSSKLAGFSTSSSGSTVSLSSTLRIFNFGGDFARKRSTAYVLQSAEEELKNQWLVSEQNAIRDLVDFIRATLNSRISVEIQKIQEELLDIAKKRYKKGLLSSQEVDKLTIDLSNSKARTEDDQSQLNSAIYQLRAALGAAKVEAVWPWNKDLDTKTKATLTSLFKVENIPGFRSAAALTQASEQTRKQSWSQLFPSINGTGSLGYLAQGTRDSFWSVGVSVSVPLFNRFSDYGQYKASTYAVELAQAQEEQKRRDVIADWETSSRNYEIAVRTAREREKTLSVSRKLYRDNLRHFKQGRISANDLAIDQQRLFNSEFLAVSGWSAAHLAFGELCHTLGLRVQQCFQHLKR